VISGIRDQGSGEVVKIGSMEQAVSGTQYAAGKARRAGKGFGVMSQELRGILKECQTREMGCRSS